MSAYSRGANFERRVKQNYEKRGYLVIRSAGSHSAIDLIAMRQGEIILIQVTIDKGRKSKAELAQLQEIAADNKCQAVLAYNEKGHIYIQDLTLKKRCSNPVGSVEL